MLVGWLAGCNRLVVELFVQPFAELRIIFWKQCCVNPPSDLKPSSSRQAAIGWRQAGGGGGGGGNWWQVAETLHNISNFIFPHTGRTNQTLFMVKMHGWIFNTPKQLVSV